MNSVTSSTQNGLPHDSNMKDSKNFNLLIKESLKIARDEPIINKTIKSLSIFNSYDYALMKQGENSTKIKMDLS